ncbi:MAG: hypothetical protein ABI416_05060 [Ginsengibacter sp.]
MKQNIITLLLVLTLFGCKKSNTDYILKLAENSGCIEKIEIPVTSQTYFAADEYNLLKSLFLTNSISKSNYRYTRTYTDNNTRFVQTMQYANNLPIFNSHLNYAFTNGNFIGFTGNLTNGTSLNTKSILTVGQLRNYL